MSDETRAKAGRLIYFTSGEYSDYQVLGTFVVLQDITGKDIEKVREVFWDAVDAGEVKNSTRETLSRNSPYSLGATEMAWFIPSLIKMGFLASVEMTEVHIGSYGELYPEFMQISDRKPHGSHATD